MLFGINDYVLPEIGCNDPLLFYIILSVFYLR